MQRIGRIEDEFNIESAYIYEGGTKSKPSNKSKNTKNTEETINNNIRIIAVIIYLFQILFLQLNNHHQNVIYVINHIRVNLD